jgi:hypothetical protein
LKLASSHASIATPAKPTTRPSAREAAGLSFSHTQATSAPNSGTVALRMADRPVVMVVTAKANSANGAPELSAPMVKIGLPVLAQLRSEPAQQASAAAGTPMPPPRDRPPWPWARTRPRPAA